MPRVPPNEMAEPNGEQFAHAAAARVRFGVETGTSTTCVRTRPLACAPDHLRAHPRADRIHTFDLPMPEVKEEPLSGTALPSRLWMKIPSKARLSGSKVSAKVVR